jgi:outer membrane protein assembly factor BamE (lipoprotein component of BamABCDE complex)
VKTYFILICAALMFATGCATRPPLKHETLAKITERDSTRAQVEELLGTPDERLTDGSRRTLYVYEDQTAKQRFHLLKDKFDHYFLRAFFLFDVDGALLKKLVSETQTKSMRTFGVAEIGTARLTEEQLGKLKELMTAREVFEILGPPTGEELTLDDYIVRWWVFVRSTFVSGAKSQVVKVVFEGETDLVKNFTISDNLPVDKKKAQ